MPRPQKKRSVSRPPAFARFKPAGVRTRDLKDIALTLDELEALRLADYKGMDHNDSAVEMQISRSTFSRLVEKARKKVAHFLIEGMNLRIEGGEVHFDQNLIRCGDCGHLVEAEFDSKASQCQDCGSSNMDDLAGRFGHGRCCSGHQGNNKEKEKCQEETIKDQREKDQ